MYRKKISLTYVVLCCLLFAQSAPAQQAPKTLPELQAKISEILAKPELTPTIVGIKVVSLDSSRMHRSCCDLLPT
jgi:hypothetical protein